MNRLGCSPSVTAAGRGAWAGWCGSSTSIGDDGICGCGPLRDHVASQLHDHRWIAPAPRRPRSRSNTQLNRPSTDYATALGEHHPVVGEAPPLVTEAAAHLFHPEPGFALVLGAYPPHDPTPCMGVDRVEGRFGHSVPEVGRPPRQRPVETDEQLIQVLVAG